VQKLNFAFVPICIGIILLLLSWYFSYPVSIDSPYDFAYNHFSYLYWIGVAILFASFFIVAVKTENNKLRWTMAIGTFFLIFSQTYFYYMICGSDAHQLRGLTEYFISTGDLSFSEPNHYYYQWPIFFILDKITLLVTGLDLRYCEFILYGTIGSVVTSFIYFYISKVRRNAYIAVTAFFIILVYVFNFQFFAPFGLSLCLVLLLFYLDSLSAKLEVTLATLTIFVVLAFTHMFTPLFFVVYSLVIYVLNRNKKHLTIFITTSVMYTLVQVSYPSIYHYVQALSNFSFLKYFLWKVTVTTTGSANTQLFVESAAQFISRIVVFGTILVTFFGFIVLLKRRKLGRTHYAMLLTGLIFAATLIIAPSQYSQMSNRSFFLVCIPVSMGASYLCEGKYKKYFEAVFLLLLVFFTFVLINQSLSDDQIFFQTKAEHQFANFMVDNINWSTPVSIFSNYRVQQYLVAKSSGGVVTFGDEGDQIDFPEDLTNYNYVAYTLGLAKRLAATNCSVQELFDANHYNLVYNSGGFSCIFFKRSAK